MPTSAYNLENFIESLESWGLTDVMLPFLLIFVILFAIMQKTRILGDDKRNMNMIVSVVISLIVVIPHVLGTYPSENWDPIVIMNKALPTLSILLIAIIMLLILIGMFGGEARLMGVALPGWISFISLALIIIIFGGAAGWWGGWSRFTDFFGTDAIALVIIILVFGIIIAFITSEPKDREERTRFKRLGEDMKSVFGGNK